MICTRCGLDVTDPCSRKDFPDKEEQDCIKRRTIAQDPIVVSFEGRRQELAEAVAA